MLDLLVAWQLAQSDTVLEDRLKVHVMGAVRHPGLYVLHHGARTIDAIEAAGGVGQKARVDGLELAAGLEDGQTVYVPTVATQVRQSGQALAGSLHAGALAVATASRGQGHKVDLNHASEAQLAQLPGIGPGLAHRIVAWRTANGRFASANDLKRVGGFGEKRIARLLPCLDIR